MKKMAIVILIMLVGTITQVNGQVQDKASSKPRQISPDLFGIFFEDISYAADGGLYAELVQNRSFEYTPGDRKGWHSLSYWDYVTDGFGYGGISVETSLPIHPNNPHYVVLNIEEQGQKGIGLVNAGFDGMVIKANEQYDFSLFARLISEHAVPLSIQLRNRKGEVLAGAELDIDKKNWNKYAVKIMSPEGCDSASLAVIAKGKGKLALDMVSLFPQKTFKNEPNGLRADLAEAIGDLHPGFMRFPGGCLVHGDGLGNMYRWKNTIGPVEQRTEQKNIWNYHQSVGLGYYEYFRFCEDIGAKPVPVIAAGVSCQNSGGTWRIGGTGQKALSLEEMQEYIQDILDLIEYANGPATSEWGAKRAAAGHPKPFNLQYIGIGNEDKQTDNFRTRFKMIYDAVHIKHPEITLIGTTGPFHSGEDYDLGWQFANQLQIPVVDEHYYEKPEWFLLNNGRYDAYDRSRSKVYLGEYASKGNNLYNALAEAAYMTSLERNGDIVTMASYAPLLASQHHTSWNPNLIYFSNTAILRTVNYYVQQLFSLNSGDRYFSNVISFDANDSLMNSSCTSESKSGDIILKIVNTGTTPKKAFIKLPFVSLNTKAVYSLLTGNPGEKNTFEHPDTVVPKTGELDVRRSFEYVVPAHSLIVIRIKSKKK